MKKEDRERFQQEIQVLGEAYGKEVSPALMALYATVLDAYSLEDIQRSIQFHVRDTERGKFFPKPADLIYQIDGDPKSIALQAWEVAKEAAFRYCPYQSVEFEDPAIPVVIEEMTGWQKWWDWPDKEIPFRLKEFCDRYQIARKRHAGQQAKRLIGLFEEENGAKGLMEYVPGTLQITCGHLPSAERKQIEDRKQLQLTE